VEGLHTGLRWWFAFPDGRGATPGAAANPEGKNRGMMESFAPSIKRKILLLSAATTAIHLHLTNFLPL
jgi:hypothetical protein